MTGDVEGTIEALELEYDPEEGFLGKLRYRELDLAARDRFLELLRSIDPGDGETLDRRLVSLLWFVPTLMSWQDVHFSGEELAETRQTQNAVLTELYRILGVA